MIKDLRFWNDRPINRFTGLRKTTHIAYALFETAWSAAWPHLDDWFNIRTVLISPGGHRTFR